MVRFFQKSHFSLTQNDPNKIQEKENPVKKNRISQILQKMDSDDCYYIALSHEIHSNNDILVVCSSIPGYYSWRNTAKGSWFIQSLCQILQKYGSKYDLLKNMTRVAHKTAVSFESYAKESKMDQKKQIPCITSKLTRQILFRPKCNNTNSVNSELNL